MCYLQSCHHFPLCFCLLPFAINAPDSRLLGSGFGFEVCDAIERYDYLRNSANLSKDGEQFPVSHKKDLPLTLNFLPNTKQTDLFFDISKNYVVLKIGAAGIQEQGGHRHIKVFRWKILMTKEINSTYRVPPLLTSFVHSLYVTYPSSTLMLLDVQKFLHNS